MAPITAQAIISGASNQSSLWPRSRISWMQMMAIESARKPVQSKETGLRSVLSAKANQMQTKVAMPGGTIMKNAARQFQASVAMAPRMGPNTGPNTAPTPQITIAVGCKCFGKEASKIACPMGMIGAPKAP
jgi:hypothetical protein